MPVDAFLDEFLQRRKISFGSMPSAENAFSKVPGKSSSETDIYQPLVMALNEGNRCPGFIFRITASKRDENQGKRGAVAPDICCYSKEHAELEKVMRTSTAWASRTFMGYTAFFIEVKKDTKLDPFRDPIPPYMDRSTWKFVLNYVETNATGGETACSDTVKQEMFRALGQNTTYATEMFARQHRHCCFSATLSGSSARFIRWDRAGAIVSEAFDIRTRRGASYLCQFLWCFARLGDAGRGYDLTVMTATSIERKVFVAAITEHVKLQMSHLDKSVEQAVAMHCSEDAISVIEVPDSSGDVDAVTEGVRRLLVSRPIVYPHFLTGRATRGYWAVEAGTMRVVFLKDTWREDPPPSGGKEGDTIMHIIRATNEDPVRYSAVVCHADVPVKEFVFKMFPGARRSMPEYRGDYQATRTQEFLGADWVCGTARADDRAGRVHVKKRVHYRLVLEIAGQPLDRFSSSRELLACTHDVFIALWYAAKSGGICHRDITPENIIIYRDPSGGKDGRHHKGDEHQMPNFFPEYRGYLIDWDLAWPQDRSLLEGALPFSGTWQFIAHRYCANPSPDRHRLEYDVESLLYVVVYCALLWLPHNSRQSVEYTIEAIFAEAAATGTGGVTGGTRKFGAFLDGGRLSSITWDCAPLQEWVTKMRQTFTQTGGRQQVAGESWVTVPLYKFWKDTLMKKENKKRFPRNDRIAELPPLNGLRKDGNVRFVRKLFVATTVPSKRPFDDVMPDSPTSADDSSTPVPAIPAEVSTPAPAGVSTALSPAASTAVSTVARPAAASSTVERAVRGQFARTTLSSMPVAHGAMSTSMPPKKRPSTNVNKLQAVNNLQKRRPHREHEPISGPSRIRTKKGKEKEVLSDAD